MNVAGGIAKVEAIAAVMNEMASQRVLKIAEMTRMGSK